MAGAQVNVACTDRTKFPHPKTRGAHLSAAKGAERSSRVRGHRIGRAASTVSRECRRNISPHDHDSYDGDLAQARARERAHRRRRAILAEDDELRDLVQAKLEVQWGPEQIAAWLRQTYLRTLSWHVCHETIYQALDHGGKGGLSRTLTSQLRTGRPLRKHARRADQRAVRFIAPALLLEHRPPVVEGRTRIDDWEGDLIVGSGSRSAIGTLVDWTSRYVKLVYLPGTRRASDLQAAIADAVGTLPADAWLTLTWDQGSEMANHDKIASSFPDGVFFAHPGSPWQRGTNENTNGLLRQYFPKHTDLSDYTRDDLQAVEKRLNNRPRETLQWQTPAQVFAAGIASSTCSVATVAGIR